MSTQYPVLYDRPINKWKVVELKEELKRRNLTVKGLKDDLVRRLDEAIREERSNLEALGQSDLDHIDKHLGSDEAIHNETENLGPQGHSNSHHIKEPLGESNHPEPLSHDGQVPVNPQEDVNDAKVDNLMNGAYIVDGASQINEGKEDGSSVSILSLVGSRAVDNSAGTTNKMDKTFPGIASVEGVLENRGATEEKSMLRSEQEHDIGKAGNVQASPKSKGFLNEVVDRQVATSRESGKNINTMAENEDIEVVPTASRQKASDDVGTVLGNEYLKPIQTDATSHVNLSNNQVYEISSNLGFQVQCESITTDKVTLSNLEKTEIKENLNANNIQLEPEVIRQETVQSLSHKDSSGDDSFYALDEKVPDVKQGLVVEADDKCSIKSSEKTYSADDVSVIDHIMENRAPDQVADDNELAQLSTAANKNPDDTVKPDVPLGHLDSDKNLDIAASVEQKELQDHVMENRAAAQVADDNELALLSSAANRNLGDTVKPDVPLDHMDSSDKKLDIAAAVKQRELQDDVSVINNNVENRAADEVAYDNELAQLFPAANRNLDDAVKPHTPLEHLDSFDIPLEHVDSFDKKLDIDASVKQRELQDHIMEDRASAQVADDTELAHLFSAANKNLDDTVKPDVPLEQMDSSFDKKLDIATLPGQRELQDDKSSDANPCEMDMTDRDPLEKINLDQYSADDSMEDEFLDAKHADSDFNTDKVGDETKSTEEITVTAAAVNEASQAHIPANISESSGANNDIMASSEKRKFEVDPAPDSKETRKRQRRWNEERADMPEKQGLDVSVSKVAVKAPSFDGYKPSGGDFMNERVVPPSSKAPTNSLRIDNFVRPFTLKAVQELLSKTGTCSAFWMDHIKTHCYVTYTSVEEAVETRNALYNLQWPANVGRLLVAEFVDPEEVKQHVDGVSPAAAPVKSGPVLPSQPPPANQPQKREATSGPLEKRERVTGARSPLDEGMDPPPIVTLDDLFRKTKATPRIYYLPLSDEQVARKLGRPRK